MRIMFAGPSGIGKTTLAEWLPTILNDTNSPTMFISGSVSDLIPSTKDVSHTDMLNRDPKALYKEDYQILNLRNKKYQNLEDFVTDRSYLDSAAYFTYKQADKIPACELEHFINLCSMLLVKQCDILVVLELGYENIGKWVTEDNNKRITSNYFQNTISQIMINNLYYMGYQPTRYYTYIPNGLFHKCMDLDKPVETGIISNPYGVTKVLRIPELNLEKRKLILEKFVCKKNW